MNTFLKNYTSNVPVSESIGKIERILLRCNVTAIAKEYHPSGNGKIIALTFRIAMPPDNRQVPVRLPANEEAAIQALWSDYAGTDMSANGAFCYGRKSKTRADFVQQGERTAWRIMLDWVEVQMSMIALKQAEPMQVFLPYVWDGNRTYYDALKENHFAAMLPERSET